MAGEKLTQQEAAVRFGTTQANVSKLCGKNPPISAEMAVKIETATKGAVPVEIWPRFAALNGRAYPRPFCIGVNASSDVQPPAAKQQSGVTQ